MGGPPFNGFALVPRKIMVGARPLPTGLAQVFRAAEFPKGWAGRDKLPDCANIPLALRYEASIFELERFQRLGMEQIGRITTAFCSALASELLRPLKLSLVKPYPPGESSEAREHPIEMSTLATVNVSNLPATSSFEDAQASHRILALGGLRLGQPVKSVRIEQGWGGTLRIGLSMPQFSGWAALDDDSLQRELASDMRMIADRLAGMASRPT